MGFRCGIVGLPNVGKSTLFNALTKASVAAANYPFCTIEPNVGCVLVPDNRLNQLADIVKPEKIIPTTLEFVDIAGLVEGASEGQGLGNQFLANIRETDAIAHVVRCFSDKDVIHVAGKVDPLSDIEVIQTELALADLDTLKKSLERNRRKAGAGEKEAVKLQTLIEKVMGPLDNNIPVRSLDLTEEERDSLKSLHLLTAKPLLYIANVDETFEPNDSRLLAIQALAVKENAQVVPICAAIESELIALDETERTVFLKEMGWEYSGLERFIRAGYDLLDLITFFTAGPKEVRAWTLCKGLKAPQAAGCIHTDFEKGFIRAEVIGYEDYVTYRGEQGVKEAGKWRLEGRDYVFQDGDVVHFRFNV